MAAGLGFKDFTTGEVLTAADVDGYLMQGIWVFADSAARDAAVTSPQEGNFAFLKDTNTTTYYTGSAWTNLDTTGMVNPMTTTGDVIYSSSGSTPARLGIGSTGQVLTVTGGLPSWATPSSAFPASATSGYVNNSTSSATYVAGATPVSVTLTTGTKALVSIGVSPIFGNHQGTMSFRVTGASSVSASDDYAVSIYNAASVQLGAGHTVLLTGLTAGSNTFELMYKSGSGTNNFQLSHIAVVDMGS